jgi:hypothetical protein
VLAIKIPAGIVLAGICWQLFLAVRFQEFRGRAGRTIYKHESPILFWLVFVSCFPLFGVCLAIVLFVPVAN